MSGDESRIVQDPICGKQVDTLRARAVGIFGGVTYYFCSAECKSKFKDPRQASGPAPTLPFVDRRKPETKREEPLAREEQKVDLAQIEKDAEPVRYARSRMRRITGEVGTPVVQIDLTPNGKDKPGPEAEAPLDELPTSGGSRLWVALAVVMLIIAGGVILFTLGRR